VAPNPRSALPRPVNLMVSKKTLKAKDIENLENTTLAAVAAFDNSAYKIVIITQATLGCASLSCVQTLGCASVYCCAGGCCVTL
jgi:hypothetical protein